MMDNIFLISISYTVGISKIIFSHRNLVSNLMYSNIIYNDMITNHKYYTTFPNINKQKYYTFEKET